MVAVLFQSPQLLKLTFHEVSVATPARCGGTEIVGFIPQFSNRWKNFLKVCQCLVKIWTNECGVL